MPKTGTGACPKRAGRKLSSVHNPRRGHLRRHGLKTRRGTTTRRTHLAKARHAHTISERRTHDRTDRPANRPMTVRGHVPSPTQLEVHRRGVLRNHTISTRFGTRGQVDRIRHPAAYASESDRKRPGTATCTLPRVHVRERARSGHRRLWRDNVATRVAGLARCSRPNHVTLPRPRLPRRLSAFHTTPRMAVPSPAIRTERR